MKRAAITLWCAAGVAGALAGCQPSTPRYAAVTASRPAAGATGATANFAPNDPPGEWRRQARDYANTRFSPLAQITPATSRG